MVFSRTDVLVLDSLSAGLITINFMRAFRNPPSEVAIVGRPAVPGIGVQGSPTLPMTMTILGTPGGQIQVRVNSMTKDAVQGEVLTNNLGQGQTARVSFLAKK